MYYIESTDCAKIAVYDMNPMGRETVVMIHGWPLSHKIFEYQTELLVRYGYRVITMDLRGFGSSDTSAGGYCYDQLADDIYCVVCTLNLSNFVLVGFSMGGAIALRYMNRCLAYEVKKLVLLGAAAPKYTMSENFPYGVTKDSVNQLIYQASTDRAQLSEDFSRKLLFSPHSEAIKNWFKDISLEASGIGTIMTAYSLRDEDGRCDLESVHVPTGIFHGLQDEIVPYELGIIQHQEIKGSKMFTFNNSGHGVFYDELNDFNRRFLSFLME